jgi:hypothetical protein
MALGFFMGASCMVSNSSEQSVPWQALSTWDPPGNSQQSPQPHLTLAMTEIQLASNEPTRMPLQEAREIIGLAVDEPQLAWVDQRRRIRH